MPSYYLAYYYLTSDKVEEQGVGKTRAEEVMEIERGLLELYRDPTLVTKPALLERRGGAFYSEAAAQLIASLHAGTGDVQVVDVRNDGALPDLPADAVVEIPARIDRDGAHPLPLAPLAPEMRGLVQAMKAFEELTIAAAHERRPARSPSRRCSRTRSCPTCSRPSRCSRRCSTRIAPSSPASSPA